jgi:hypothetical protein
MAAPAGVVRAPGGNHVCGRVSRTAVAKQRLRRSGRLQRIFRTDAAGCPHRAAGLMQPRRREPANQRSPLPDAFAFTRVLRAWMKAPRAWSRGGGSVSRFVSASAEAAADARTHSGGCESGERATRDQSPIGRRRQSAGRPPGEPGKYLGRFQLTGCNPAQQNGRHGPRQGQRTWQRIARGQEVPRARYTTLGCANVGLGGEQARHILWASP